MGQPLFDARQIVGIREEKRKNLLHGCDPEGLQVVERDEARNQLGAFTPTKCDRYLGRCAQAAPVCCLMHSRNQERIGRPIKLVLIEITAPTDPYFPDGKDANVIETVGWLTSRSTCIYLRVICCCFLFDIPLLQIISGHPS
jgi:hypothetical protein